MINYLSLLSSSLPLASEETKKTKKDSQIDVRLALDMADPWSWCWGWLPEGRVESWSQDLVGCCDAMRCDLSS